MKITFHGAARTVTGSKHLLTLSSGKNILLDCGFFQGHGKETFEMNRDFNFDPASIDYLILSHAHIDHSGNVPHLVKAGFKGQIYSTSGTRDLCAIMLADTAHIQQYDTMYLNKRRAKKNLPPLEPLYGMEDVDETIKRFLTVPFQKVFRLDENVDLMFTESGHILGAAAINLTIRENGKEIRLFFSGDIGRKKDRILRKPEPFPQADIILCESTYGNRLHEGIEETENRLLQIILDTCVNKKGKLIIPAFSLGRTQEIVYSLNNLENAGKLPRIPVYVDSPLSTNATNIMRAHPECFNNDMIQTLRNDPDPFGFNRLVYIQRAEDSIKLNERHEPMIILSASGMAEAGRIKHHIKNNIENPNNTILIAGYCTPESLGGRIAAGNKEVFIFGKEYKVNAGVQVMNSYSAHGDYEEMIDYLSCQKPAEVKQMFLVHGEYKVQQDWKEKLIQQGYRSIEIPEMKSSWEF